MINLISKELNCEIDEITDVELSLVDTQQACLGGVFEEFIFGGRLDNQVGAYCSIASIIESSDLSSLENDNSIRVAAIYDHEEVGSESAQGAASALTEQILRRLSTPESFDIAMARSFLISADQVKIFQE